MIAIEVRTQARNVRSFAAWSVYRSIIVADLLYPAVALQQVHCEPARCPILEADICWHDSNVRFVPIASSVRRAMTLANMRQNGVRTLDVTLDPAWDAR